MAYLSEDGKSIIVEDGDTFSQLSEKWAGGLSNMYTWAAYAGIKNVNKIVAGEEIPLMNTGTESNTKQPSSKTVGNIRFGEISTSPGTLYITWTWGSLATTKEFKVEWSYYTGDDIWFSGSTNSVKVDEDYPSDTLMEDTYNIPTSATSVRVRVRPIARTKDSVSGGALHEWTVNWSSYKTWYRDKAAPDAPKKPSVEIKDLKLTASLDNINNKYADQIEFQVCKNNATSAYATKKATITAEHASHVFTIEAGGKYKVRARAYSSKNKIYSEWSDYSENKETIPATVTKINDPSAESETSVYLSWSAAASATSYEIEYTTKKEYFDKAGTSDVKTETSEFTERIITGLESGKEYFFRVRAVNSVGSSDWSGISMGIAIGVDPDPPTTWSSTTTVVTGEPLILYWMHNSRDGSSETHAELEVFANDVKILSKKIPKSTDEDEKDLPSSYTIDTSVYTEGTKIKWQVRTAGATKSYGQFSTPRTIDVYAPPTLQLNVYDNHTNEVGILTSFPVTVSAIAGPNTQIPIGYYLTVTSGSTYETIDSKGNPTTISIGDVVYSKYYDPPIDEAARMFSDVLSANNVDLENGVEYTVSCTVSMNSGLTAESSTTFTVQWEDSFASPNAKIDLNEDTLTTTIVPYCEKSWTAYYKVEYTNYKYVKTNEDLVRVYGTRINTCTTTTGEPVYSGTAWNGETIYYCIVEESTPVTDVYLSIYRREFDGGLTELATELDGEKHTTITDPHPSLDLARYRIVAISKSTGSVSYTDLPGHPIGATCVIIQWDEDWVPYDVTEDAEMVEPAWTGSLLKLPYNIDVSDNNKSDVTLVKYIGREHPVSYYGTQLGQTSTWSMEIPKSDKETIYALRRLSSWMGDVYVREPSGSGYWANISVSFNLKHRAVTVPVTIDITRVEGGA